MEALLNTWVMDALLNTWHGYAFVLVVIACVWAVAALFAYATFLLVARYNYVKYDAKKPEKLLRWPEPDYNSALYRDFRSEDELKRRH